MNRKIYYDEIINLSKKQFSLNPHEAQKLIKLIKVVFDKFMCDKYNERDVRRLTTKFRDAGRRSAPWKPTSSRVPGRPQDGADGNRINRWLLEKDHKFYANEVISCLVEIKYYLIALSFQNAPIINNDDFNNAFIWLIGHKIAPGEYKDPIQLIDIDMDQVIKDARTIQSGHLHPLDRDGKHEPSNTFIMLARSNQLQGNLTLEELLILMEEIIKKHKTKLSK